MESEVFLKWTDCSLWTLDTDIGIRRARSEQWPRAISTGPCQRVSQIVTDCPTVTVTTGWHHRHDNYLVTTHKLSSGRAPVGLLDRSGPSPQVGCMRCSVMMMSHHATSDSTLINAQMLFFSMLFFSYHFSSIAWTNSTCRNLTANSTFYPLLSY